MYALSVRRYMTGINPITAFAVVSQYTAAALVACMLVWGRDRGWHAVETLDAFHWTLLIASSVIGIGLGHTFYFYSIARLGVVVAAGIVQLQPITVAIASSVIFPEDRMTAAQWVTGVTAVAGAVMMMVVQGRLLKNAAK
jgi:drug/metabolite transporter (DMT)-like permease